VCRKKRDAAAQIWVRQPPARLASGFFAARPAAGATCVADTGPRFRVGDSPETFPAGGLPNARGCTGPVAKVRRLEHRTAPPPKRITTSIFSLPSAGTHHAERGDAPQRSAADGLRSRKTRHRYRPPAPAARCRTRDLDDLLTTAITGRSSYDTQRHIAAGNGSNR
jgi:hypothetical protein